MEKPWKTKAGRIFHLATPPEMVRIVPKLLADAGRNRNRTRDRIVVEKPLGHDLDSAREMSRTLRQSFDESQKGPYGGEGKPSMNPKGLPAVAQAGRDAVDGQVHRTAHVRVLIAARTQASQ